MQSVKNLDRRFQLRWKKTNTSQISLEKWSFSSNRLEEHRLRQFLTRQKRRWMDWINLQRNFIIKRKYPAGCLSVKTLWSFPLWPDTRTRIWTWQYWVKTWPLIYHGAVQTEQIYFLLMEGVMKSESVWFGLEMTSCFLCPLVQEMSLKTKYSSCPSVWNHPWVLSCLRFSAAFLSGKQDLLNKKPHIFQQQPY